MEHGAVWSAPAERSGDVAFGADGRRSKFSAKAARRMSTPFITVIIPTRPGDAEPLALTADQKGIELITEVDPAVPAGVIGALDLRGLVVGVIGFNMDVRDGHVDLRDIHAHDVLNGCIDSFADVVGHLLQGMRVLDHYGHVDGDLSLPNFDVDTLGQILLAHSLTQCAKGTGSPAAERVNTGDVSCGNTCNFRYDAVGHGGGATVCV